MLQLHRALNVEGGKVEIRSLTGVAMFERRRHDVVAGFCFSWPRNRIPLKHLLETEWVPVSLFGNVLSFIGGVNSD